MLARVKQLNVVEEEPPQPEPGSLLSGAMGTKVEVIVRTNQWSFSRLGSGGIPCFFFASQASLGRALSYAIVSAVAAQHAPTRLRPAQPPPAFTGQIRFFDRPPRGDKCTFNLRI